MGKVIGIEVDVKGLAWAIFEDGRYEHSGYIERSHKGGEVVAKYDVLLTRLMEYAAKHVADVFIEDIYLAPEAGEGRTSTRNVEVFKNLALAIGEVKRVARVRGVYTEDVPANVWRGEVHGVFSPRDAAKRAAKVKADEVAGCEERNEHVSEAICIGIYGCRVNERTAPFRMGKV